MLTGTAAPQPSLDTDHCSEGQVPQELLDLFLLTNSSIHISQLETTTDFKWKELSSLFILTRFIS